MVVNPALLLATWLACLVGFSTLPWPGVGWAALALLGLALLISARSTWRLLRRSRWLLFAVVVMFAGLTPGMPIQHLPWLTLDGVLLAADQVARLVVSLALVAWLLERCATEQLLSGFHGLLSPLSRLGFNVERLVLRIALTLRRLELTTASTSSLSGVEFAAGNPDAPIRLPRRSWSRNDLLLGLVLCLGAIVRLA